MRPPRLVLRRRRVFLAALAACAAGAASSARAQPPACPTAASVADAVRALRPADAEAAIARGITVGDQGDAFVVTAAGRSRTFSDPDRSCTRRAEWAAAFVALASAPDAAPVPPPPPSAPPPPREHGFGVELGARAGSPGTLGQLDALAFSDRISWWWAAHRWSVAAGFGSPLAGTITTIATPVRVRAWPSDLSLRRRFGGEARLRLAVDAGFALEWVSAKPDGVVSDGLTVGRFDPGFRFAMTPRVRVWRGVEAFAGVELGVFPWAPTLDVVPEGEIGRVQRLRPRLALGVGWSL